MSTTFRLPPRALRMRSFGGPSVWLEFNPLSRLTAAINLGMSTTYFHGHHQPIISPAYLFLTPTLHLNDTE